MDLTDYGAHDDPQERAAEVFARFLHNEWGVGTDTPACGGAGVLLFLSQDDRAIYISRGSALASVMTDRRLDRAIARMRPLLQRQEYDEAILGAIHELDFLIQFGEPKTWERVEDWVATYGGIFWVLALLGFAIGQIRHQAHSNRAYAQVASQLDELDRARAEALQGHFRAVSCPICLEAFPADACADQPTRGSDGLPLRLLRCGHVFDEKCWTEWVNRGHGKVDKCPICQQDVGRTRSESQHQHHGNMNSATLTRRVNNEVVFSDADTDAGDSPSAGTIQRVMQQYQRERLFRLTRLGHRYPQFVRPHQIQRWGSYEGSLSRDPAFVNSNPAATRMSSSSSSRGGGGSSFSGGSSGGGRGGRW
jgi:uncharacterized membrane protein YgcG